MIAFEVKDMTCGHCVSTITKALNAADKDAKVQIDLATHRVQIEPTEANAAEFGDAIKEAGYTPVSITAAPASRASDGSQKGGGCCGGGRRTASVDAGQAAAPAIVSCCG